MIAIEDHARSIFLAALERAPEQWPGLLDEACSDNVQLRGRVNELLLAHQAMGSIHGDRGVPAATTAEALNEAPGTVIGPYKLLEQIGEGGFGVVFMAEQQQPIRRKVALKVLKPGMDSRQVIARFEAERQALALMDHPNIARVLDAAQTAGGRPYFVMELVKGIPITEFCDQARLTPRERLELFIHVCQAVQHAHQKGIIHRDIKPSNVLVTMQDGAPLAKVIDFGIAKALGQQLTDKTLYTGFAQMIGTPLYMSPEQAALSNVDVDTRSDIYSLGVLLYELLTGTTPFDKERLGTVGYDEMRRIIREEEPPKPSTRMSTLGKAASTVSIQRQSDPRRLSQLFRGELDWIVMKALEKERSRRYEAASALEADVQRYLDDEPVQAFPPSAVYRLRKFVRRNRGPVAAAASALAAVVLAALGLLVSNVRIAQEQAITKKQRDEAEANFRKARQAVDDQFTLVSQSKLFDAPGFQVLRKQLLESALNYYQDFLQQRPDDPALQVEVAAAHLRLYQIDEAIQGTYNPDAMEQLEKAITIVERLRLQGAQDAALYRPLAGFAKGFRSLHGGYNAPKAQVAEPVVIPLFQRTAAIWEDFVQQNPAELAFQSDLAVFYYALQEMQASVGEPALALVNVHKGLALCEKIARETPRDPECQAQLAQAHDALASRLRQTGPASEVEKHIRLALDLRQKLAKDFPNVPEYRAMVADNHFSLGYWLKEKGRPMEAEQAYGRGLVVQAKLVGEFPGMPGYRNSLAAFHESLGNLFRNIGENEKAEQSYREALTHFDKLAAEFPEIQYYRVPYSRFCLCVLLAASGREAEAKQIYRRVLEFKPQTADGRNLLAYHLAARPDLRFSDPKRALELAKQAVEQAPDTGYIWNTLGLAHYRNGNWHEAILVLYKSMQLGSGGDSFDRFLLAMAHWQLGNKEEARTWFSRAVQFMEKNEQHSMSDFLMEDLQRFRTEASELLGIKEQPKANERPRAAVRDR
jgi:serine/threonine protein kinase/Flp pilus assembly protein TadD